MKKKSYIFICLGILLILASFALISFSKSDNTPIENNEKTKWNIIHGTDFDTKNYETIEFDEYKNGYFNDDIEESNNKYSYLYPSNLSVVEFGFSNSYLNNENLLIEYRNLYLENIDEYIKKEYELIKDNDNSVIFKYEITNNQTAYLIKTENIENNSYYEKLFILSENYQKNYSQIIYHLQGKKYSDKDLSSIINGFKLEKGKASRTNCEKQTDGYICTFDLKEIKGINNILQIKINNENYLVGETLSIDNYSDTFTFEAIKSNGEEFINTITLKLVYKRDIELTNEVNSWFFDAKATEEITINDKSITKYFYTVEGTPDDISHGMYYVNINKNLGMIIKIDAIGNNIDSYLNDFLDYELKY